jgi:Domain of unknown function (DUF1906)
MRATGAATQILLDPTPTLQRAGPFCWSVMSETLVLDYSFARPTPASIRAAGYSAVMRYLSTAPGHTLNPKDLTTAEVTMLHAAGLGIGLVWETTATRAGEGQAAGAADALAADAQADALGYPLTCPLFYACDYDAAPNVVAPYFTGVKAKARRPVGVYGSARVIEGTLAPYKWQCSAWSHGVVSSQAHLYQRLKATVAHPISGSDENIQIRPFPLWTPGPVVPQAAPSTAPDAAPVPVTPLEDAMRPWFIRAKTGAIVIVTPTGVRAVDPATWTVWRNLGFGLAKGMDAMDPGPFGAILASLGGLVK